MKAYLRITTDNKDEWIANRFNATSDGKAAAEATQKRLSDKTALEEVRQPGGGESKWVIYRE